MNSNSPRTLRGQLLREVITLLLFAGLMLQSATAVAPDWWSTRGVLTIDATADDYAIANLGQLKSLAQKAALELDEKLPGGAGNDIHTLINSWKAEPTEGGIRDDYAALTLGQLKSVGKLFYDQLANGYFRAPSSYPWSGANADDYALANVGQLKHVFAFDTVFVDTNHNGIPDLWEMRMFGNLDQRESDDFDHDGLDNLAEFQAGTRPDLSDSDSDGYDDSEEIADGKNPNGSASHPIDTAPPSNSSWESLPLQPATVIKALLRNVENHWSEYYTYQNNEMKKVGYGTYNWIDSDDNRGAGSYDAFEPRWEQYLKAFSNVPLKYGPSSFSGSTFHRLTMSDTPYDHSGFVMMSHQKVGLTNMGTKVPWQLGKYYLRSKTSLDNGGDGNGRKIDGVEMQLFKIYPDLMETLVQERVELAPPVKENAQNDDNLDSIFIGAMPAKAFALDTETYSPTAGPQLWFMVPVGEASPKVYVGSGANTYRYGVFQTTGDVAATSSSGTTMTTQFPSDYYTFTSSTEGDSAVLQAGIKPSENSPASDAKFAATPALFFAAYSKKKLTVNIIPIALQKADGSLITPSNIPPEQDLQDFLNDVFKTQANIEVTVKVVSTTTSVAYDIGLGRADVSKRGEGNGALDLFYVNYNDSADDKYSDEEQAILNATKGKQISDGINIFFVAGATKSSSSNSLVQAAIVTHPWENPKPMDAATYGGWAGSSFFEANVRATWVMDYGEILPYDYGVNGTSWVYQPGNIYQTIAHEVGHVLGLSHSTTPGPSIQGGDNVGWNLNSDYESRLMTDRVGLKQHSILTRLIKAEWDMLRNFGTEQEILKDAN